jgi:DNA ligase D-like protein (predicted 3'-phosphoesterase)
MARQSRRELADYQGKRDFGRTSEPKGDASRAKRGGTNQQPKFVIQKHDATALHYDFRLETEGVLKSWAVPKGPSTDPRDKRLAMPTEDHPLEYVDFEGVIPEEEYGAGPVIVWDRGTYRNMTLRDDEPVDVAEAIERGHLKFWLDGEKITGGYALTRVNRRVQGGRQGWILVKLKDKAADARRDPVASQPESVISDRTIEEVAAEASHENGDGETGES